MLPETTCITVFNWEDGDSTRPKKDPRHVCWRVLHSAEFVQTEGTMALLYYVRCFNLMVPARHICMSSVKFRPIPMGIFPEDQAQYVEFDEGPKRHCRSACRLSRFLPESRLA